MTVTYNDGKFTVIDTGEYTIHATNDSIIRIKKYVRYLPINSIYWDHKAQKFKVTKEHLNYVRSMECLN